MRSVIQRVSKASVTVAGEVAGSIDQGILALVGLNKTDTADTIAYMMDKIMNLRIFEDERGKMNLSVLDIQGKVLIVPNFTLYGDARKGRRPSYDSGAAPSEAAKIFADLITYAKEHYPGLIEQGVFQAEMQVALLNDGPVTLLLDSDKLF